MVKGIGIGVGIVIGVLLVFVVGGLIMGVLLRAGDAPQQAAISVEAREWVEIARFQGNGTKDTETFTTPDEWRISWVTKPAEGAYGIGLFTVWVKRANGSLLDDLLAANVTGADQDSTIIRRAGGHYLSVSSTQPWEIVVEGQK